MSGPVSSAARSSRLRWGHDHPPKPVNESVVRELSQQLVRVGNLLNQVTRLAHTEARTGGVDASTMARVVSGIDQTRATIAALDGRLEDMSRR